MDITLTQSNEIYEEEIPEGFQGIVYIHKGSITVQNQTIGEKKAIYFKEKADKQKLQVTAQSAHVRFFVIAGRPIKEPIAKYGPFVMNTREEIMQAFQDYHNGKFTST